MDEAWAPPVGPDLDTLVAERAMGWRRRQPGERSQFSWPWFDPDGEEAIRVPRFSTDIDAAWRVFKWLIETEGIASIHGDMEDYGREKGDIVTVRAGINRERSWTGPASEAICRLALWVALNR
jgi:hypothetical protein